MFKKIPVKAGFFRRKNSFIVFAPLISYTGIYFTQLLI